MRRGECECAAHLFPFFVLDTAIPLVVVQSAPAAAVGPMQEPFCLGDVIVVVGLKSDGSCVVTWTCIERRDLVKREGNRPRVWVIVIAAEPHAFLIVGSADMGLICVVGTRLKPSKKVVGRSVASVAEGAVHLNQNLGLLLVGDWLKLSCGIEYLWPWCRNCGLEEKGSGDDREQELLEGEA